MNEWSVSKLVIPRENIKIFARFHFDCVGWEFQWTSNFKLQIWNMTKLAFFCFVGTHLLNIKKTHQIHINSTSQLNFYENTSKEKWENIKISHKKIGIFSLTRECDVFLFMLNEWMIIISSFHHYFMDYFSFFFHFFCYCFTCYLNIILSFDC